MAFVRVGSSNFGNSNSEAAIRTLKKKLQTEGYFATAKRKKYYEAPSEKKVRKAQESKKRIKKNRRMGYSR